MLCSISIICFIIPESLITGEDNIKVLLLFIIIIIIIIIIIV